MLVLMDHPLGSRVLRSKINLRLSNTRSIVQLERCLKHKVFVYDVCESEQFNVCLVILEASQPENILIPRIPADIQNQLFCIPAAVRVACYTNCTCHMESLEDW
jgi:hypothetical protein